MPDTISVLRFEDIKGVKYSREECVRRAKSQMGKPFLHIPGNLPAHKVLAEIDGIKLRVEDAEMLYNDMQLMNYAYGEGVYELNVPPLKQKALAIVKAVYDNRPSN